MENGHVPEVVRAAKQTLYGPQIRAVCEKKARCGGRLKEKFEKNVFAPMKYWELSEIPEPTKYHGFAFKLDEDMPDEVGFFGAGSWY